MRISPEMDAGEIAAIVSSALQKHGRSAVLSGGAAVTIYSENEYQSSDLDFISPDSLSILDPIMFELGFSRDQSRFYTHPNTAFFVEFPQSPVMLGSKVVREWSRLETDFGPIEILSPTQCVMDRLAAFYHWNDRQCLDQALMVARRHSIDFDEILEWSKGEGAEDQFREFLSQFNQ